MCVFEAKLQGLCRQNGGDALIPILTDLRSVVVLSPPPFTTVYVKISESSDLRSVSTAVLHSSEF